MRGQGEGGGGGAARVTLLAVEQNPSLPWHHPHPIGDIYIYIRKVFFLSTARCNVCFEHQPVYRWCLCKNTMYAQIAKTVKRERASCGLGYGTYSETVFLQARKSVRV